MLELLLPAITCPWRLHLNFQYRRASNDRFSASNLKVGISRTGQLLPVVVSAPKQTLAYLDFSIAAVRR